MTLRHVLFAAGLALLGARLLHHLAANASGPGPRGRRLPPRRHEMSLADSTGGGMRNTSALAPGVPLGVPGDVTSWHCGRTDDLLQP
jgi:hypothetical protein